MGVDSARRTTEGMTTHPHLRGGCVAATQHWHISQPSKRKTFSPIVGLTSFSVSCSSQSVEQTLGQKFSNIPYVDFGTSISNAS